MAAGAGIGLPGGRAPSRREPFTGQRLIAALRESGFRAEDVAYLPTDYTGADEIIRAADLAMVYGGQDVVDKYATDPTVWVNGPGRAKISDHRRAGLARASRSDRRVDLHLRRDGLRQHHRGAVRGRSPLRWPRRSPNGSRRLTRCRITDERALLPVVSTAPRSPSRSSSAPGPPGQLLLLGADQVVADFGDGTAALRPAVHLLAAPDPARLNTELAFPCVWVSPWSRDDGLEPLRRSLVVNAITDDERLIDELLDDPTVANVYSGPYPTWHSAPHIPHDGFLADFLMRNKGFIRSGYVDIPGS